MSFSDKFKFSDFEDLEKIGYGAFSEVFSARHKSMQTYALKRIDLSKLDKSTF